MVFQYCIDQGCPHVMAFQNEPLFTQDETKGIMLLISRSILFDQQNHIFHEANNLLDCVGLQIGNGSINFFILLNVSIILNCMGSRVITRSVQSRIPWYRIHFSMHFPGSDVNGWPMRVVMAWVHSGDKGFSWDGMHSGLSGTRGAKDA